jgi:abelson tyrosine-protein kinase 1
VKKQLIGQGQGGAVYLGLWGGTKVAMKCVNKQEQTAEFFKESAMLLELKHPHILQFLGFSELDGDIYMITPYMKHGSLIDYLRSNSQIAMEQRLQMATHIAIGMNYLANNDICHRDLACRNCLVDGNIVKIADFGLSRRIQTDYYKTDNPKMPFKWSAPESLLFRKFSTKSDVYSFGVCLWEILSSGMEPFPDMTNSQVVHAVCKQNLRLEKPNSCPETLYELMCECWHVDPEKRPTFKEVYTRLQAVYSLNVEASAATAGDAGLYYSSTVPEECLEADIPSTGEYSPDEKLVTEY